MSNIIWGPYPPYEAACALLLANLSEGLPLPHYWMLEENEQKIALAVTDLTKMTPELWNSLSPPERVPWVEKTNAELLKQQQAVELAPPAEVEPLLTSPTPELEAAQSPVAAPLPTPELEAEKLLTITDAELAVLRVLCDNAPVRLTMAKLAKLVRVDRKTIGATIMTSLVKRGLVDYLATQRKGAAATPSGQSLISSIERRRSAS